MGGSDVPASAAPVLCCARSPNGPLRIEVRETVHSANPSLTLIFPYVFEGKGQASVLALDDANLPEGSFAHNPQKSEVIEVHCRCNAS